MEVVMIEKETLEILRQRFENFVSRMDALCAPFCKTSEKWMDNSEVCRLLNVSIRTIQTYRDTGKLAYSQINGKIYYKASDVEDFIRRHLKNNSQT